MRARIKPRLNGNTRQRARVTMQDFMSGSTVGKVFNLGATQAFMLPMRLRVSGDTLTQPYRQHAWVYACISRKALNISSVPLAVKQENIRATDQEAQTMPRDNVWQQLFDNPNPHMTGEDLFEGTSVYLDHDGECKWLLVNTDDGRYEPNRPPEQIWLVPSPRSLVPQWKGQLLVGWKGQIGNKDVAYPADQIVWHRNFNPYDRNVGLAPMEAAMQGLRTDWKAGVFSESFLDNGADPGGTLTTDLDLTDPQKTALRQEWQARHGGPMNRGRVAVLEGGLKYQPIAINQQNMQFLEQREWTRDEVLAVFGVPKLEVGLIEDINRNTAKETKRLFWENVLIPRMRRIERTVVRFMIEPVELQGGAGRNIRTFVEFDLSNVEALKQDLGDKLDHADKFKKLGYGLNAISARLELGMEDVEWGEEPLEQVNRVPVSTLYDDPGGFLPQTAQPAEERTVVRSVYADRKEFMDSYIKAFFHPAEQSMLKGIKQYYARMRALQIQAVVRWANKRGMTKNLPPLTAAEIESFLLGETTWGANMEKFVTDAVGQISLASLSQLEAEMGGFSVITPDLDTAWVRNSGARRVASLVRIAKKDRVLLRKVLLKAFGEVGPASTRELQTRINKWFGGQKYVRSLRIARTETAMLSNGLRNQAMKGEGIDEHEWMTSRDDHVRPAANAKPGSANHRKLDTERRKRGKEPFSNGLMYPAQPGGRASEVINCRCVAVPV